MYLMMCGAVAVWLGRALIHDNENAMRTLERTAGFRLRRPTYLPGFHLDQSSPVRGQVRGAMWRYERDDGKAFIGVAEEKRTPGRDEYNRQTFEGEHVPAPFTMTSGFLKRTQQNFVYREFEDIAVILTSYEVPTRDLIKIANSMK